MRNGVFDRIMTIIFALTTGLCIGIGEWGGMGFFGLITVGWTFGPELHQLRYGTNKKDTNRGT